MYDFRKSCTWLISYKCSREESKFQMANINMWVFEWISFVGNYWWLDLGEILFRSHRFHLCSMSRKNLRCKNWFWFFFRLWNFGVLVWNDWFQQRRLDNRLMKVYQEKPWFVNNSTNNSTNQYPINIKNIFEDIFKEISVQKHSVSLNSHVSFKWHLFSVRIPARSQSFYFDSRKW